MSVLGFSLRLLLIAVLAMDGMATAVASVHMSHSGMAESTPQSMHADRWTAASCQDARPTAAPPAPDPSGPVIMEASSGGGSHSPDCCGADCRCACMHLTQVAIVPASSSIRMIGYADIEPRFSPAHASPVPSRLIRPPIG